LVRVVVLVVAFVLTVLGVACDLTRTLSDHLSVLDLV